LINGSKNQIKQNEWKADISKQRINIERNEKKLSEEVTKHRIGNIFTVRFLSFMINLILRLNKRKLKKY
tara:strand:- start:35 stop:241 length:207 start_codon:yes stop_codon:yes gene_type:complete